MDVGTLLPTPAAGDLLALLAAAEAARAHGVPRQGAAWAQTAARLANERGEPRLAADAMALLALHQVRLGELEQAADSGQQAVSHFAALGPSVARARAHNTLSLAYERAGLCALAVSQAATALEMARELADPSAECWALIRLGTAADEADAQHGLELLGEAVELARHLPIPEEEVLFTALNNLSRRLVVEADRHMDDGDRARATLQTALSLAEEAVQRAAPGFAAATAAANLGGIHRRLGHADEARRHFSEAMAIADQRSYAGLAATLRLARASLDVEVDPGAAQRQALARLLDGPAEAVDPDLAVQARRTLVQACRAQGDVEGALQHLERLHQEVLAALKRRSDLQARLLFNHAELHHARHAAERSRMTAELERLRADAEQRNAHRLALDRDLLEREVAARTVELQQAMEAVQAASRAKSEFLSIASHELRTPLNGVVGMVELARRNTTEPRQAQRLATAAESAQKLSRLIDSILQYVHADRPPPAAATEVDLRALLQTWGDAARARGLPLAVDVDPALPPRVRVDGDRLGQIVAVLLDNAVKFSSPGPVRLEAGWQPSSSGPAALRLAVSDVGPGLAPELRQRLFSPFELGDGSSTRTQGGLGLGLALAQRLAQTLGGELGVEPHPPAGSSFWVRVPVAAAPSTALP